MFGLVTAEVGRGEVRQGLMIPRPGHDKHVPRTYFLKDRPAIWLDEPLWGQDASLIVAGCTRIAQSWRQQMTLPPLREEYGPDFARVRGESVRREFAPASYIVVWRRLPAGLSAEQAWAEFQMRLDTLARRGHLPAPPPCDGP